MMMSAITRWLARTTRPSWFSEHVRLIVNTTFVALLMAGLCLLWPATYTASGRILMPSATDHRLK
jgi:hypothetical protein